MQLRSTSLLACVALLVPLGVARPALAWTDARARSARVVVDVDRRGDARVFVSLHLQVRGGWLEGFEVSGLDPDARLDALKPPVLVSDQGTKWTPEARVRPPGRLLLSFPGRGSPRRGHYQLNFAYRTSLAHRASEPRPQGRTRFTWTLPAWQTGLEDVEVWVWAPSTRASAVDSAGLAPPEARRTEARTLLRFHRMHLPRATDWPVSFELPDADLDPSLGLDRDDAGWRDAALHELPTRSSIAHALTLMCLLWLFIFARLQVRHAAVQGQKLRYALGSPGRAVGLAAVCITVGAMSTEILRLLGWVAAVAACVSWPRRGKAGQRFGRWERLGREQWRSLRRARLWSVLGLARYPDPLSLSLLGGAGLSVWYVHAHSATGEPLWPWLTLLACLSCVWTPRRWGASFAASAARIFELAERFRMPGIALGCRAFVASDGSPAQPRLQLYPAGRISGVQRLEVGVDERFGARGFVVLATTGLDAPADRWLTQLDGTRRISPGARRACHLFPAADAEEVERTLRTVVEHCGLCAHELAAQAA